MSTTQISPLAGRRHGVRVAGSRTEFAFPSARPEASAPRAAPRRPQAPGRVGAATSCMGVVDARGAEPVSRLLKLKVAAVAVIALLGAGVAGANFVSWSQPDPAVDVVVGDPGWAHVTDR